jgi:hypothetical protein
MGHRHDHGWRDYECQGVLPVIYISYSRNGKPEELSDRLDYFDTTQNSVLECNLPWGTLPRFFKVVDSRVVDLGSPPGPSYFYDYDQDSWVDSRTSEDVFAEAVHAARFQRDAMLAASDWTQVPDAPVDQEAWAAYRQALRDVTQQSGWPRDINWPVAPQ